jgi:hypothetical protein
MKKLYIFLTRALDWAKYFNCLLIVVITVYFQRQVTSILIRSSAPSAYPSIELLPPAGAAFRHSSYTGTSLFSVCDRYSTKTGTIKETNGFNRGNKLNTSAQSTRIDRIFFDSGEVVCRVTNKRQSVCRQR